MLKRALCIKRVKPTFSLTLRKTENYKTLPILNKQKEAMEKYKLPKNERRTFQKKQLSPIKLDNEFFILNLNQSHKFSILSKSLMKNIMFHFKHYETNSFLQTFLFKNFDQNIFSLGTDFKMLKFLLVKNEKQEIKDYFNLLYKFNHFLNTYPKPFLVQLDGVLTNSAIGAFGTLPFSYSNGNSSFHFNSVDFNFIPHGGESFMLKNLPFEKGIFLALTGGKLTTKDLLDYEFLKGLMDFGDENLEILKHHTKSDALFNSFDCYEPVYKEVLSKRKDTENMISEFFMRSENENPREVLLDLYYRKKMIENANIVKLEEKQNVKLNDQKNQEQIKMENNHYWFDNYFVKDLKGKTQNFKNTYTDVNADKISSIFCKNSIEEIFTALEEDNSEFAIKTLSILKSKNKDVLEIILKMLRKARNMTYVQCMELEYNTMIEMINNENLKSKMFQTIKSENSENFSLKKFQNLQSQLKKNSENKKEIDFNFKSEDFILKDHLNDLAPIKYYYNEFPEAFLCYFNKVDLRNIHQFENYVNVVKTSLFRWGIDYMNPSFDHETIKRRIQLYFRNEKKIEEKYERTVSLLGSEKKKVKYIEERKREISEFFGDENFGKNLNEIVNSVFNDAYYQNEKIISSKNENFANFLKSRLNKDVKNCFVRTRLAKKKNIELSGDKFEEQEELPIEITSDRFTLSEKTKKKVNFDKLKEKYKILSKVKEKNNSLENFIKGNFNEKEIKTKIEKMNENIISYNANSILERDVAKYKKKDWEFNKDFAYYLCENGLIQPEINFRKNLVKNLQELFEMNSRKMSEEERNLFYEFLKKEFFMNYKDMGNLIKMTENSVKQIYDFRKKRKEVDIVDLNLEEKNYDFVKKKVENSKDNKKIKKKFDIKKIEGINDYIYLEPIGDFISEKKNKNSFYEDLSNSDILQPDQKKFFRIVNELKYNNEFFMNFSEMTEKLYSLKLKYFDKNLVKTNSGIFKTYVNKNLELELHNIILPHVFYHSLKEFLKNIQIIYQQIKFKLPKSNPESKSNNFNEISIILKNSGFKKTNDKKELSNILKKLDFLTIKGLEIYKENSEKLIFEEDKMEKKMDDFILNLKNNLSKSNLMDTVINEIESLNDNFKVSDLNEYKKYHLDFELIKNIMIDRNHSLKDFNFEKHYKEFFSEFRKVIFEQDSKNLANDKNFTKKNKSIELFYNSHEKFNDYFKKLNIDINIDPFSNFIDFYTDIKNSYLSSYYSGITKFTDIKNNKKENLESILTGKNTLNLKIGHEGLIYKLEKLNKISIDGTISGFDDFYKELDEEKTLIPESFSEFDYRQKGKEWFDFKIYDYVKKIFDFRKRLEVKISDEKLVQLDYEILNLLKKDNLRNYFDSALEKEVFILKKMTNDFLMDQEDEKTKEMNINSIEINQKEKNFDDEKFKKYYSMILGHATHKNSSTLESIYYFKHVLDIFESKSENLEKELNIDNKKILKNYEEGKIDKTKTEKEEIESVGGVLEDFDYSDFCIESMKILKEKNDNNKLVDISQELKKDIEYVVDKFKIYS